MKIALRHEAVNFWLAGEPGVSERTHSSAADLEFSGDFSLQAQDRLRAPARRWADRKNLGGGVSFTTVRKFAALAEAEEFAATYDLVWPRTGYLDLYGAAGTVVARLYNAVVKPPRRTVTGVSVKISYDVVGGASLVPDGLGGFNEPEITMGGEVVTMG